MKPFTIGTAPNITAINIMLRCTKDGRWVPRRVQRGVHLRVPRSRILFGLRECEEMLRSVGIGLRREKVPLRKRLARKLNDEWEAWTLSKLGACPRLEDEMALRLLKSRRVASVSFID